MHWLLQEFEDTHKLAEALDQLGYPYSWHKVIPFVGDLSPAPEVDDGDPVILFGSYTLWKYSAAKGFKPGVFRIKPFIDEAVWHPFLVNGSDARLLTLRDIPDHLPRDDRHWFMRPVDDSKAVPGRVHSAKDIHQMAGKVLALDEDEIPGGSLRHDTQLMLSDPVRIEREWRLWVVDGEVVTYSLYKEGRRVVYRHEIEPEALTFAQELARLNPGYAPAYVLDICRTAEGLRMLETNCINAAGFYAADMLVLARALNGLSKG